MTQRPKRSRKIVNYGEDHLHWVEETQLQKALLRSLHEKDSHHKSRLRSTKQEKTKIMKGQSVTEHNSCITDTKVLEVSGSSFTKDMLPHSVVVIEELEFNKVNNWTSCTKDKKKRFSNNPKKEISKNATDDCFDWRLTRLQSKLLEDAGMTGSEEEHERKHKSHLVCGNEPSNTNPTKLKLLKENCDKKKDRKTEDIEGNPLTPRVRAQRKFACNASPPKTRSSSPVKMHKHKLTYSKWNKKACEIIQKKTSMQSTNKAVRACSIEIDKSNEVHGKEMHKGHTDNNQSCCKTRSICVIDGIPNTDSFLNYLCFRNTTVKVEFFDYKK